MIKPELGTDSLIGLIFYIGTSDMLMGKNSVNPQLTSEKKRQELGGVQIWTPVLMDTLL